MRTASEHLPHEAGGIRDGEGDLDQLDAGVGKQAGLPRGFFVRAGADDAHHRRPEEAEGDLGANFDGCSHAGGSLSSSRAAAPETVESPSFGWAGASSRGMMARGHRE
jgi:hypothetical protein